MLQTGRKPETARQSAERRKQPRRKQNRENAFDPAQTLEAILAGGSWEQLPAERILALSHTLGNSALLDALAQRETGPERLTRPLPGGELRTAPAELDEPGRPLLAPAPEFGMPGTQEAAAPLAL